MKKTYPVVNIQVLEESQPMAERYSGDDIDQALDIVYDNMSDAITATSFVMRLLNIWAPNRNLSRAALAEVFTMLSRSIQNAP